MREWQFAVMMSFAESARQHALGFEDAEAAANFRRVVAASRPRWECFGLVADSIHLNRILERIDRESQGARAD